MTGIDYYRGMITATLAILFGARALLRSARWLVLTTVRFGLPVLGFVLIAMIWLQAIETSARRHGNDVTLGSISIGKRAPGVLLGRENLLQNETTSAADEQHVWFTRRDNGTWAVSNVSNRRRLWLEFRNGHKTWARRIPLVGPLTIDEEGAAAELKAPITTAVALTSSDDTAYRLEFSRTLPEANAPLTIALKRGTQLLRRIQIRLGVLGPSFSVANPNTGRWNALPPCSADGWYDALANRLVPHLQAAAAALLRRNSERLLLYVGGNQTCRQGPLANLGVTGTSDAGLPFASLRLYRHPHFGWLLGTGHDPNVLVRFRDGRAITFKSIAWNFKLDQQSGPALRSFIAGKTVYELRKARNDDIAFDVRPLSNPHRVPASARSTGQWDTPDLSWYTPFHDAKDGTTWHIWQRALSISKLIPAVILMAVVWVLAYAASVLGLRILPFFVSAILSILSAVGSLFCNVTSRILAIFGWPAPHSRTGRQRAANARHNTLWREATFSHFTLMCCAACVALFAVIHPAIANLIQALLPFVDLSVGDAVFARSQATVAASPWPAAIAWCIAFAVVLLSRPASLLVRIIFLLATALLAVGSANLASLGFSSTDMRFMRFWDELCESVPIASLIVIVVCGVHARVFGRIGEALVPSADNRNGGFAGGYWLLAAAIFALLVAWIAFGTETGIAGVFQPSEAIKSLALIMLAATMTRLLRHDYATMGSANSSAMSLAASGSATRALVVSAMLRALPLVFLVLVLVAVPVAKSDQSPALMLTVTFAGTSLTVAILHWVSVQLDAWAYARASRLPIQPARAFELRPNWFTRRRAQSQRDFRRFISRPIIVLAILICIGTAGIAALLPTDPARIRGAAETLQRVSTFRTVADRVLSWLELRLPGQETQPMKLDYLQIGRQVAQTRALIHDVRCRLPSLPIATGLPAAAPGKPWPTSYVDQWILQPSLALLSRFAHFLSSDVCVGTPISETPPPDPVKLAVPEIQNDFIGGWVLANLGFDGAVLLVWLQAATILLLIATTFRIIRWIPGREAERNTANFWGYALVGFTIMLALHWYIAWSNTLGLVPVMGQPMTFIAAGRSHFLLFAMPVFMMAIAGLRWLKTRHRTTLRTWPRSMQLEKPFWHLLNRAVLSIGRTSNE